MAQGTIQESPRELAAMPPGNAPHAGDAGLDLAFATSVAQIRLQGAAELGAKEWDSSVKSSFRGSPEKMKLFVDLHRSDPEACHRLAEAITAVPEVGTELLGFQLLAELGKGAFGRVYLAQQGDLANRLVVLKVSPHIDDEPRTLAQLQHTNIVPVYSVHRAGPLQAVCMPYFGSTTLANLLAELDDRHALPESGKEIASSIGSRGNRPGYLPRSSGEEANFAPTTRLRKLKAHDAADQGTPGQGTKKKDPFLVSPGPNGVVTPPNLALLHKLSYVEAVLWIGRCLADGLAHAHEHGIVHRDLKPANILLTDDGQPMLLDFNLAQDTKLANNAATAQVGGTLPFMAPEQIEAFRAESVLLDYRSDLYSLGVILYRMLTGRQAFPIRGGLVHEVLEQMIQDRAGGPPAVRCWNKSVSPAVESIIQHCLHADPNRRYQSARQLKEDLDRHLENQPLRHAPEPSLRERVGKWRRRHPRLASVTSVATFAGFVIAALLVMVVMRGRRLDELSARESLTTFLDGKKTVQYLLTARADDPAQIDEGIELGRETLKSFGMLEGPIEAQPPALRHLGAADQALLRKNTAELLLLLARGVALQASNQGESPARQELVSEALRLNERAESCFDAEQQSRVLWTQRAELTGLLGRDDEAKKLQSVAQSTPLRSTMDRYLAAAEHAAKGRYREALPLLAKATAEEPQDYASWFLRGVCFDHLSQGTEAIACYNTCIALAPQSVWAHLNRGISYLRQHDYRRAADDLDDVIVLRPRLIEAYKHRSLALQGLKKYPEAIADLTRALELGAPATHVYFLRAAVRERAGDREGAKRDRDEGMRRPPADEMGWLTRGYARMTTDPKAALDDFDQALKLNARSLTALQNKAHILSKMGRNEEAARALDKAVEGFPDFISARAGRGVLLARLGKRQAAHKDAVDCLARDNKPLTLYQLAGIYALTSQTNREDRLQAFRLLSIALQKGFGFDLLETDKDLDPIRKCPEFQKLVEAARAIRSTAAATKRES